MSASVDLEIRPLGPDGLDDLLAYFDGDAFADNPWWAGCFCNFYESLVHPAENPDPTTPAFAPFRDRNRAEKAERIRAQKARGYLAYRDGKVVGWLNAQSKEAYANPRGFAPAFGDMPDRTGVLMCFVVAPDRRAAPGVGDLRDQQLPRDPLHVRGSRVHRGRVRGKLCRDAEGALMAHVVSLQLHEGHGKPMRNAIEAAVRVGGGIEGDSHVDRSKRAVTVVDRSTHDAVGVQPGDLREQITVEGLPALGSLGEGTLLRIGAITLRVNGACDPCTHIGEMNGIADPNEFQSMLEGRRGLVCNIVAADGPVRVGDEVSVMETADSR